MKIKKLLLVIVMLLALVPLTSCRQADTIKHNISKDADFFKTYRRMTFINLNSDKIIYSAEGYFSLQTSYETDFLGQQEIGIIFKIAEDEYKMDYFSIANNVTYVIEQIENTHTNPYYWEIKWYIPRVDLE